jgi:hypothetical protein
LSQVGCIRKRDRAFRAHPVKGSARIEPTRKRYANSVTDRNTLQDSCHGLFIIVRSYRISTTWRL